jgi:hypothetical protein
VGASEEARALPCERSRAALRSPVVVEPARLLAPLRDLGERLADGFRRSDRFLRMRVAVVAAWAAVSLATLFFTCPSTGPANALGAEVHVREAAESFIGGAQVLVRNESDEVWSDVVLTIDGEWRYSHPAIRPREQIVVATTQFQRRGEPLGPEHRPRRLVVACDRGSHAFDLR